MQRMASGKEADKRNNAHATAIWKSFGKGARAHKNVAPGSYHPEHIQGNPRLSQCWDFDAMPLDFDKVTMPLGSSPERRQRFFTNPGSPIH